MDIDTNNFKDYLDNIKTIVDGCDFISIDTELTGLHVKKTNYFDTPELRYKSLKDNAMKYAITQFGICAFKYNVDDDHVSYAPFNFHLLPHQKSEKDNFVVNVETISFLNKHKFDFNKSWRDGLPSMRLTEFQQLLNSDKEKIKHELSLLVLNEQVESDFSSLKDIISECEDFLNNDEVEMRTNADLSSHDLFVVKEHLSNKIGCINGNWIFPVSEYDKEQKKKIIRITKCSNYSEKKRQMIIEQHETRERALKEKVVFSELIKYIGDTGKFIIGHNCLLDCLHMYDNYIGPLPEDYKEFKTVFNKHFPNFIDTRYLISESKHAIFQSIPHINLQTGFEATETLSRNPKYSLWNGIDDFNEENKFHTAHYDAFITGKLFLNLSIEIDPSTDLLLKNFQLAAPNSLEKYKNKFNVVYSELKFLNLSPSFKDNGNGKKHVFHVTIPGYWQMSDVFLCLAKLVNKPLRSIYENIRYDWIDKNSLMIRFPDDVKPSEVPLGCHDSVTIKSFDQYFNLENNSVMEADGFTMAQKGKRKRML